MGSMEGDGIRGKRQRPEGAVPGGPGEMQVDSEDEQVEKFFALLRSIGEMRGQWRRAGGDGKGVAGKRTKAKGSSAAWTPTFQWEDFAGVPNIGDGRRAAGASREGGRRGKEKEEEEGTSLDLRLSL